MFADKRLTEAYEKARVEYIDETSNYVFFERLSQRRWKPFG